MFSVTLLLAFFQLVALTIATAGSPSPLDGTLLDVKRAEQPDAVSKTTTVVSTTAAANPNCPTEFQLSVLATRFQNYYTFVNSTGQFNISDIDATTFTIKNNRLITVSSPGGIASVPKGTGQNGAYLRSTIDVVKYDFVDAALDQNCYLKLTKKVSPTFTLNAIYAILGSQYLANPSNAPPVGFQVFPYAKAVAPTTRRTRT